MTKLYTIGVIAVKDNKCKPIILLLLYALFNSLSGKIINLMENQKASEKSSV